MAPAELRIGCAGWSIPRACAERFPGPGTHLERYARVFEAVEVNSTFSRPHRPATWRRWAQSVPDSFRFAVKVHRDITHRARLADPGLLDEFLAGPRTLGPKLGPLLVQLPPSLAFDAPLAGQFFRALRDRFAGDVACEPRHGSWTGPEAERLLARYRVARVAADPAPAPGLERPGGWRTLVYLRLHGAPRRYFSSYSDEQLATLARRIARLPRTTRLWCVFDNTAAGAAVPNALALLERLRRGRQRGARR